MLLGLIFHRRMITQLNWYFCALLICVRFRLRNIDPPSDLAFRYLRWLLDFQIDKPSVFRRQTVIAFRVFVQNFVSVFLHFSYLSRIRFLPNFNALIISSFRTWLVQNRLLLWLEISTCAATWRWLWRCIFQARQHFVRLFLIELLI